jgi:hypothetical protein
MTKIEISFRPTGPLDEAMLKRLAEAHGIYGIQRVRLTPSLDAIDVEYDASRLTHKEVEAALRGAGIPVERTTPKAG